MTFISWDDPTIPGATELLFLPKEWEENGKKMGKIERNGEKRLFNNERTRFWSHFKHFGVKVVPFAALLTPSAAERDPRSTFRFLH